MKAKQYFLIAILFAFSSISFVQVTHARQINVTKRANQILDYSGVKGGLVVHLGCNDGKLTAAFYVNQSYLVHGLDTDDSDVNKARVYIRSKN